MMLSEIKRYLIKRKRVTINDLSVHFDTEPAAMKGMLEQWIRKGKILKSGIHSGCNKTCSKCCDATTIEIYEWIY